VTKRGNGGLFSPAGAFTGFDAILPKMTAPYSEFRQGKEQRFLLKKVGNCDIKI
jgi:hypothetical protein